MYTMLSGVVVAAAEKMPEESYSFKPTPEVPSFGEPVGHVAEGAVLLLRIGCGRIQVFWRGREDKTSKADLVAALKEAVAYYTVYAGITTRKAARR